MDIIVWASERPKNNPATPNQTSIVSMAYGRETWHSQSRCAEFCTTTEKTASLKIKALTAETLRKAKCFTTEVTEDHKGNPLENLLMKPA